MEIDEIIKIIKQEVERMAGESLKDMDEDIFFKSNFIDSINILNLIAFLEDTFNIEIDAFFEDREAASSVKKLALNIQSKLKSQ